MAYAKTAEVKQLLATLPDTMPKILRGAARAAAKVVAAEAEANVISDEVRASIRISTSERDGRAVAKVQTKGPGAFIAPWLEYGTSAHFITVDEGTRAGRSIGRVNKALREGTLVINGRAVGPSVFHPGARPHPFLRPALDMKEAEAVAEAQSYIARRLAIPGIPAPTETDDAE